MKTLAAVLCLLFSVSAAIAQNNRSFVSTTGNDANLCTAGNECRSFTRAISVTNAGGEIIALNSGGYGPFTVDKGVMVSGAPGVVASITASGDGIDVAAGSTDRIILRGLTITLTGAGIGIFATTFRALSIETCSVRGGLAGIVIAGSATSYATAVDTVVRNMSYGIQAQSRVALVRCRVESTNQGLTVLEAASTEGIVSAVDFVAVDSGYGVAISSASQTLHPAVNLDRAMISDSGTDGILASGEVWVRVSNSVVLNSGRYGFNQSDTFPFFGSRGNNMVQGSGTSDVNGTISAITAH